MRDEFADFAGSLGLPQHIDIAALLRDARALSRQYDK